MGRGSWPHFVHPGDDYRSDPKGRDAHGIIALKRELVYNGFGAGIVVDLPFWGTQVTRQAKEFQKKNGLTPDGVVGPRTATALFRKRCAQLEHRYGITNYWLTKIKSLESGSDPVAQGEIDPQDEGIVQINLHFNPTVTIEQAWDPAWALDLGASRLKEAIAYCNGNEEAAVAAWNIGRFYAKQWGEAGEPDHGGPKIGSQDGYTRAYKYVSAVAAAAI